MAQLNKSRARRKATLCWWYEWRDLLVILLALQWWWWCDGEDGLRWERHWGTTPWGGWNHVTCHHWRLPGGLLLLLFPLLPTFCNAFYSHKLYIHVTNMVLVISFWAYSNGTHSPFWYSVGWPGCWWANGLNDNKGRRVVGDVEEVESKTSDALLRLEHGRGVQGDSTPSLTGDDVSRFVANLWTNSKLNLRTELFFMKGDIDSMVQPDSCLGGVYGRQASSGEVGVVREWKMIIL